MKKLVFLLTILAMVSCRHSAKNGGAESNVKAVLSDNASTASEFLVKRGLKVDLENLSLTEKPEKFESLEAGDVLVEAEILIRINDLLTKANRQVSKMSQLGSFLNIREKSEDLATMLKFKRPNTDKTFGITVAAELAE